MTTRDLMADLDAACAIIDDARHAIAGPGPRVEPTIAALHSEDAARLIQEWTRRKKDRLDPIPTHVRVHGSASRGRG